MTVQKATVLRVLKNLLTLKDAGGGGGGGGGKVTAGREIVCHFSQSYAMVTKNLDFIHIHTSQLHCKCLQGFTGTLRGNECAGVSNLQGLQVTCNACKKI